MYATACAASLAMAGCGDDESASTGPVAKEGATQLRVPFNPGFGSLAVHVADVRGIFAKHGLDVELTEGRDTTAWPAALGRQFDIVMTVAPELYVAGHRGLDIVGVTGMQLAGPEVAANPLMTKDPAIRTVADLAGKTVGVTNLAGGTYNSLLYLLDQAGVDRDDVNLTVVPFATQGDQLDAGRLDAAISALGFAEQLEHEGYRQVLDIPWAAAKEAGAEEPVASAFFATSRQFLDEQPDAVAAFHDSIAEGIAWIDEHPEDARRLLQEWLSLSPEVAETVPLPLMSADLATDMLAPYAEILKATGMLKDPPDTGSLVEAPR